MILTNEQMLESLSILAQADEKGMLGYAIARNRQKLLAEVQDYSNKRDELLKKYGNDIGEGKYQLQPESAAAFFEELKPYSELSVDVAVMKVSPEVFCSGNLSSQQMFSLGWMVEE